MPDAAALTGLRVLIVEDEFWPALVLSDLPTGWGRHVLDLTTIVADAPASWRRATRTRPYWTMAALGILGGWQIVRRAQSELRDGTVPVPAE
jgi:hypothetical protein